MGFLLSGGNGVSPEWGKWGFPHWPPPRTKDRRDFARCSSGRRSRPPLIIRVSAVSEHELAAALFFEPAYRRLWRDRISAGVKSRRKILSRLYHFDHLDPRLATRVSGRDRSPARLAVELRARRAPD